MLSFTLHSTVIKLKCLNTCRNVLKINHKRYAKHILLEIHVYISVSKGLFMHLCKQKHVQDLRHGEKI